VSTTTIPLLPCLDPDRTIDFYGALGFTVSHRQDRPYLYLALALDDVEIHFKEPAPGLDAADELSGGLLLLVDDVAPLHRAFVDGLRHRYGRVLATGLPRLTRLRPGQTRFTVFDPSGNSVVFIERDEPGVEYGGSSALSGLAKAHDNVRIFRDFKNDDALAARALDVALNRHRATADRIDVARALADRAELAVAFGDRALVERLGNELEAMRLSDDERAAIAAELTALDQTHRWMTD
jgi:catechol 2,3-dioxygenase-like lactoylglutathione lyase family enzyme